MSEVTTVRGLAGAGLDRPHLLVIVDGRVATHEVPAAGAVVLGRAAADVIIEHPSISRRHAQVHLGAALTVEDLGSANGTRVRGVALPPGQPCAIDVGEAIELGAAVVIVQAGAARQRSYRVWAHGSFEARLEDECARVAALAGQLALLRVSCEGRHPPALLEERLARALRERDVVGSYAPNEYEVLSPDTAPDQAAEVAAALTAELGRIGVVARVGVACCPRDHRAPYALFAAACAAVRPHGHGAVDAPVVVAPAMRQLYDVVARVAASDLTVLITGETGVGKELVADRLHHGSTRARGPLVRVNAGAIAESLIDAELFGHEPGAFTGAVKARAGVIESGDGGTVFFDEIAELPLAAQAKLLRVLEDRLVTRVGATRPRAVDVRFVAATHRDLEAEVARGAFRADLYFRLSAVTLRVPALRERVEEIVPLAVVFARAVASRAGQAGPTITAAAAAALERYQWPGNVRELRNAIERAVLLGGDRIEPAHLPVDKSPPALAAPVPPSAAGAPAGEALRRDLVAVERDHVLDALARCGGNQTEAARLLGISRRTLSTRLDQLAITRPRKR